MRMNFTGYKNQIRKNIIEFVTVNMMDKFMRGQLSAQVLFHYVAVLKNEFTTNGDNSITLSRDSSFSRPPSLSKMWVAVTIPSQIMAVAHTTFFSWSFAIKALFHTDTNPMSRGLKENRMNSGKPVTDNAVGNPEPSPRYTLGRCRDYWRGLAPLITSKSVRPERDEIVRPRRNTGYDVYEGHPDNPLVREELLHGHRFYQGSAWH